MIHDFETWATPRREINPLSDLAGTVIAIEADFYLDRLLNTTSKEPLLAALGGSPFGLNEQIKSELRALQDADITPIFVFKGLDSGRRSDQFKEAGDVALANAEAWDLYSQHQAERAVETFGNSGFAQPSRYYRLLQRTLQEENIDFQVAPHSAWGQLAYLAQHGTEYVDAIAGSSELVLFDVDKFIIKLDFDRSQFHWLQKQGCIDESGLVSSEAFVDACMITGSAVIPTLPVLANAPLRKHLKFQSAVDLVKASGLSGISACLNHQVDPQVRQLDYVDAYKRTRLAVKHEIILTAAGKVEPFDAGNVPSDLHEVVGQRLPDELYYYLSTGGIGSRILNQLTTQQIIEVVPVDGGESDDYRTLIQTKLTPLRTSALSLIAHSLTRVFQHRNITLRCWFDVDNGISIRPSNQAALQAQIGKWKVPEVVFRNVLEFRGGALSLPSALGAISKKSFVNHTFPNKDASTTLDTDNEVTANALWRFLHIREYITNEHTLSAWGQVLSAGFARLPASAELEEATLLAVELMRVDLLNSRSMFPAYSGAPLRGSDQDKLNSLLLSRVACLARLSHEPIGFTGPLSRHLLGFNSMVVAVENSLRDLLEMCFVTLLLNGDATRENIDVRKVGLGLPFLLPLDASLGIAMKHYLDELAAHAESTSPVVKDAVKDEDGPRKWFPHAEDFRADLEKAFMLWDGVYAAFSKAAELGLVVGREEWDRLDEWAQERR